jgi:hypothetical protein
MIVGLLLGIVRILNMLVVIRWNRDEKYYRQASWRGTLEQDGGALMNFVHIT